MRLFYYLIISLLLTSAHLSAQDHKYPKDDFFNRNIELPVDYDNPRMGTFYLYYELASNFDFNKPTLFFFQDAQQEYGVPGKVDVLAQEQHLFEDYNVLRYEHRGRKYSHIELKNDDGTVNWEKAYRVLSSKQVVEDIERIREDLFKDRPNTKILIYGRSGGGYLAQEYLAKYSQHVEKAFIGAAANPVIRRQLGYIESKYFYNTLAAIDTTLHQKLQVILDRNIVPEYQLLWMLNRIPYRSQNPGDELSNLINELYEGKSDLYEEYLQKQMFDFAALQIPEEKMNGWQIGLRLRQVEFGSENLFAPKYEYIDPLSTCLLKLSEPFLKLIKEQKVDLPVDISLDALMEVETEVFYLAGKNDHVVPYQIGIELGNYFKNYELFIADDNHNMTIYDECYPLLRSAFFQYGIHSKELEKARNSLKCNEWKPE